MFANPMVPLFSYTQIKWKIILLYINTQVLTFSLILGNIKKKAKISEKGEKDPFKANLFQNGF